MSFESACPPIHSPHQRAKGASRFAASPQHCIVSRVRTAGLAIALAALASGCAHKKEPVTPVSQAKQPALAYHAASCKTLAPELVSWARQEHELSAAAGRRTGRADAQRLNDVRQQKEAVRTAMRSNGCF